LLTLSIFIEFLSGNPRLSSGGGKKDRPQTVLRPYSTFHVFLCTSSQFCYTVCVRRKALLFARDHSCTYRVPFQQKRGVSGKNRCLSTLFFVEKNNASCPTGLGKNGALVSCPSAPFLSRKGMPRKGTDVSVVEAKAILRNTSLELRSRLDTSLWS